MFSNEQIYFHLLNLLPGISYKTLKIIYEYYKNPKSAWENLNASALNELGFKTSLASELLDQKKRINPDLEIKKIQEKNIKILTLNDDLYPFLLKNIFDPPFILYVKGDPEILSKPSLAVVGTRNYSDYGKKVTFDFTSKLTEAGLVIVSGLAAGIDTFAHQACLEKKGQTVAVFGCGINYIYPPSNKNLAEKIAQTGALISEFPPDRKPEIYFFPMRNRILSGLTLGTLAIEAKKKSGALITARLALEHGREVFTIPADIYRETAKGTNELLKDGKAMPVLNPQDILDNLSGEFKIQEKTINLTFANDSERKIYDLLSQPLHIDELIRMSEISSDKILAYLSAMEIKGFIKNLGGMKFERS